MKDIFKIDAKEVFMIDRTDVPQEYCWNVSEMYGSLQSWEEEFQEFKGEEKEVHWPKLLEFKGKLNNAKLLRSALDYFFDLQRKLERIFTYAHLRFDEDLGNNETKNAYLKATSLLHQFSLETAWIQPELLHIPEEEYQHLLSDEMLLSYKVYLKQLALLRKHILSEREEELLALSGNALQGSSRAFSAFQNADLKFPKILDSNGKKQDLTLGKYATYMHSKDRILRKNAYEALFQSFVQYENTLCEILSAQVQSHLFIAKAKHFTSCLEAALFPHQIDKEVYHNLIASVKKHLPSLHKYTELRKKALNVEKLYPYDLYVSLFDDNEFTFTYEEARDLVIDSVRPLGEKYQKILQKGLADNCWVDVFENSKKRSGAYSSGCYDSMPYILMNYEKNLSGLMTLAHEAGHSMHSYHSNHNQPYHYAGYPIFVAEVASTLNEQLMLDLLLKRCKEPRQKAALLNHAIEGIRGTLFRQTLFAEFELYIHVCAEENIPLTPDLLRQKFLDLNREYYGEALTLDEYIGNEWSRIPHFYYNFYVYQYATGISSAFFLFNQLKKEPASKEVYLNFLSSGGSDFPLKLLKKTGVDLAKPEVINNALQYFDGLVEDLQKSLQILEAAPSS